MVSKSTSILLKVGHSILVWFQTLPLETTFRDWGGRDWNQAIPSLLYITIFLILILCWFPSAYHVANWDITTKAVKTHTAANCACRSPGTLPAIFIAESMMDHVARSLQLDVEDVKKANLYQKDQVTLYTAASRIRILTDLSVFSF